jgi:mycofactocin precursor
MPMDDTITTTALATDETDDLATPVELDIVDEELLVEEVSIDGMCGVY